MSYHKHISLKEKTLKIVVKSNIEDVHLIGATIRTLCTEVKISADQAAQIELCVVEAVNNCIKHAYHNDINNDIEVIFVRMPQRLTVTVCDEGRSIPPEVIADCKSRGLDFDPDCLDVLPESGMGLFLIHTIMDEVNYSTWCGKNRLTMTKHCG